MMTNLFSVFDPSTGIFHMNWLSTLIGYLFIPMFFWVFPSRISYFFMFILGKLVVEMKMLIGFNHMGMLLILNSLFIFILFNNLMGLLPYIFTSSSHLVFTLSMALPLWVCLMFFGWLNKTNMMFCHLIPVGTPSILMPFMVCIETISNIIRPGSLAVRLTANMIAGHLLMSLLGNVVVNMNYLLIFVLVFIQVFLMLFESAVAVIQAYVFSILSTLYSSEV